MRPALAVPVPSVMVVVLDLALDLNRNIVRLDADREAGRRRPGRHVVGVLEGPGSRSGAPGQDRRVNPQGERHVESRPAADLAFEPDATCLRGDQLTRDVQPEAQAGLAAGAMLGTAIEPLEQLPLLVGRDA